MLHVIASVAAKYGGPSAAVRPMARAVRDRGHEVEILTTDRGGTPVGLGGNDEVSITYCRTVPPRFFGTSPGLVRELRRRLPELDVVHLHSLYLFHTIATASLCRAYGVPYVLRPHGTLNRYHRSRHRSAKRVFDVLIQHRLINAAAGIHVTSESERQQLAELALKPSVHVIPLGIDGGLPPTRSTDRDEGCPTVTFLGRLSEKKGVEIVAEAFGRVAHDFPLAELVIAGPDEAGYEARVRAMAVRFGFEGRVRLPGFVDAQAKSELLSRSSVFVLPSADENLGVAVLEAMAAGVPVVLSEHVAVHREVAEVGAGYVTDRTPEAVARAIARVLHDGAGGREMGERGRRLVAERFAWPTIGSALESMYRRAVDSSQGSPRRSSRASAAIFSALIRRLGWAAIARLP